MWPNPQETANLDTLTKETLNEKLYFLRSVSTKARKTSTDDQTILGIEKKKCRDKIAEYTGWNQTLHTKYRFVF